MAKVVYTDQKRSVRIDNFVEIRSQEWHGVDRRVIPNDARLEGM